MNLLMRLVRYAVRTYEWARGWRHYPWSSSPPQRLFSMIANRSRGLPGAHFRAIYTLASGVLKFRERLFLDRVNFSASIEAPVNAHALAAAALWEQDVVAARPMVPRAHLNLRVQDAERAQLDRLVSVLLLSESAGSINIFFDDMAAVSARSSTLTLSEESRQSPASLAAGAAIPAGVFSQPEWSRVFSRHAGFDGAANNFLKVAHGGALVVALGLQESDDGFCDEALTGWLQALASFESPRPDVDFVVLNAVRPSALREVQAAAPRGVSFARAAGLSFAETLRVAQHADVFLGQMDIYGVAAKAAQRPGVYIEGDMGAGAALERLKAVIIQAAERPRNAMPVAPRRAEASSAARTPGAATQYTLVVPTYNRPELLARLLRYLQREKASFPVLVLDSSEPAAYARNQDTIAGTSLDIRHAQFDSTLDPYAKIGKGLQMVTTPYCSICADDDLLIVAAVQQCVAQLERRPDAVMAHGWYFNFIEQQSFELSYVMYRGKSIEENSALARLRTLFAAYEALFYGVFRTQAAARAFRDVERVDTVLGKELLTGAISILQGKALRLPCFYYGRNTAESLPYSAWHPQQILAMEPSRLFEPFPAFRSLLIEALQESEPHAPDPNAAKSIELIFLRYLDQFLRNDALDLMLDMSMRGASPEDIYTKVWDVFVRIPRVGRPQEPLVDSQGRYAPERLGSGKPRDYQARGATWDSHGRTYNVHYDFIFPAMQPSALMDRESLLALLRTLDAY